MINNFAIEGYLNAIRMKFNVNDTIFVATGLGKDKRHKNNFVLRGLHRQYKHLKVVKASIMKRSLREYFGRETCGLIEMLICGDSQYFIGDWLSTFSKIIWERYSNNNVHMLTMQDVIYKSTLGLLKYSHPNAWVSVENVTAFLSDKSKTRRTL